MIKLLLIAFSILSLILLPGCWNRSEMTESGVVQALAIDQTSEGKIGLRTHIYKPGGGSETDPKSGKGAFLNIHTEADSVFEAIRDISRKLGRKAQWSHTRIIMIGEQTAKNMDVNDITDFFIRDHEPRATISIVITQGNASEFLDVQPYIEHTLGQQLRTMEKAASRFTAKSVDISLLNLAIQSKSEVNSLFLPYARLNNDPLKSIDFEGVAILKDGKMVDYIPPVNVKTLLMLVDKYKGGIFEIPCTKTGKGGKPLKETLEIRSVKSKVKPVIEGDSLHVQVSIKIKGFAGELHCSSVMNTGEATEYTTKIQNTIKEQVQKTVKLLKKKNADVIGIGNKIHKHNPEKWKKWKGNWDERFMNTPFNIDVNVIVENYGLTVGKQPSLKTP
jgi:spore germination protein KC